MSKPQKSKPRLGRGLSSLISMSDFDAPEMQAEAETANISSPPAAVAAPESVHNQAPEPRATVRAPVAVPVANGEPLIIAVDAIVPNPHQPRRQFNEASLAELAASLKSTGMIQPVIVRANAGGYELVAGERRWRAAKLAGLTTIPAVVRQVDGFTQAQMALVENIQREDLNPIDRAAGYRTLIDQLGLTQAELAGRLGEDRSSIANFLRLLDLAEPVRDMVRNGQLTLGHAKLLAGVSDLALQLKLAKLVVSQTLSVRNLERLIARPESGLPEKPKPSAHLSDLAQSLTRQLQMQVELRAKAGKGKGKLIIHYGSLDQFDDLMAKLGVQTEK